MIFTQLSSQLERLEKLLLQLTDQQYTMPVKHLSGASIGGHTRHIIELLNCAVAGRRAGRIDYFNRNRNLLLESNLEEAINQISALKVEMMQPDSIVQFVADETGLENPCSVDTTYYREIVYNTEHAIHHLALIRVALIELELPLADDDFGMAPSTIRFKQRNNKTINSRNQ